MKKNILRVAALAIVLVMAVAMLASCGNKLSGTYSGNAGFGSLANAKTTFKFSGSNVTMTVTTTLLGSQSSTDYKGKYEIIKNSDGTEGIKFTYEGDGSSYSGTQSFEKGDKYIKIGGVQFDKQ